ncbi:hypothetical protein GCM10011410_01970 [Hoyosella rhizosphaerae]|uniref:Uncharacterized protein n=1 Tax=Hoyosella rhizosphaerae TaxID=1755582 RepID=A0A916TZU1_9ACTN|nr:hypothetical protein GCM10011410_01970 [Hoyosella rhizosphaerae]
MHATTLKAMRRALNCLGGLDCVAAQLNPTDVNPAGVNTEIRSFGSKSGRVVISAGPRRIAAARRMGPESNWGI